MDKNHWLLGAIQLPPLPAEVIRGEEIYRQVTAGLKAQEDVTDSDKLLIAAYARYAFVDKPAIPARLKGDPDVRVLKVGMQRTGNNSFRSTLEGIITEEAQPVPDRRIIEGKILHLKEKTKRPIELSWQSKPMRPTDPEIERWFDEGYSGYGVHAGMGGQDHKVLIFDLDCLQKCLDLGVMDDIPETFTVAARKDAAHCYVKVTASDYEEIDKRKDGKGKITFYDPVSNEQLGELKIKGSQCVGPGSCHWQGGRYCVTHDAPLAIVSVATISSLIGRFAKQKAAPSVAAAKEERQETREQKDYRDTPHWLDHIRLENFAMPLPPFSIDDREGSGEVQGSSPLHGSDSGHNYSVNLKKNIWFCHRDGSGGGVLEFIAVKYGVIECSEAVKGWAKVPGRYRRVLQHALIDEGLPIPVEIKQGKADVIKKKFIEYLYNTICGLIKFKVLHDGFIVIYDPETGCYNFDQANPDSGEHTIDALCREIGGNNVTSHVVREVMGWVRGGQPRVSIEDFDNVEGRIVVKNGILDMKSGELSDFSPDFLSLCPCPIPWEGMEADTQVIDDYLEWCLPGDRETQAYMWQRFGSMVAGTTGDQTLDMWYSPRGDSGKSTWMNLLQGYVATGPAIWTVPIDLFAPGKGGYRGNKQFSIAEIRHRKALFASEPGEGTAFLDDQTVKQVTGDINAGRHPWGKRESPVVHDGAVILATNPLMRMPGGTSPPIKRRLRIVRFDSQVGDGNRVAHYEKVLVAAGGPGILRRLVEGYRAYLKAGVERLKPSPNMEKWLMDFIVENDPLFGFLGEILQPAAEKSLTFQEIHAAWEVFLKVSGYSGLSYDEQKLRKKTWLGRTLKKQLEQKGWKVEIGRDANHRGPMVYQGLSFTDTWYEDFLSQHRINVKVMNDAFDRGEVLSG
jgi:P4 family phage/plasmid primase-like protien